MLFKVPQPEKKIPEKRKPPPPPPAPVEDIKLAKDLLKGIIN